MKKVIIAISYNDIYIYTRFFLVLFILLIFSHITYAQDSEKRGDTVKRDSQEKSEITKKRLDQLVQGKVELGQLGKNSTNNPADKGIIDPMRPITPSTFLLDSLTNQKYLAAMQEYYDYHVSGLQHRRQVFKWQLFSAKLIFVVVLFLVFAGIYFAAVQFHSGLRSKTKDKLPIS